MYIPKGNYLTVEQFRLHIGGVTKATIMSAIKDGRLKGSIQIDAKTILIPRDAILFSKAVKNGKYVGLSQFIKGNIETQEEVKNWENRQAQLRKMREGDIKDVPQEDTFHDYY